MRGSSCAPAAAARSVPATCTSHLVPSPQENHDAREASPRSSPSTDPTRPTPRLGFSCPGEAGRMAQAVLWCRGSIPLRTCMEQGRGAGISMDQGVPGHWRGEMRKGRSSASHRGTPLTPAITYTAPATHTQQAQQRTCSPSLPVFRAGSPGHGPGEGLLLRDISLLGGQQTLPWEVNSFLQLRLSQAPTVNAREMIYLGEGRVPCHTCNEAETCRLSVCLSVPHCCAVQRRGSITNPSACRERACTELYTSLQLASVNCRREKI